MAVTLSPRAVQRVRTLLEKEPGGVGLRLGLKRTGCSGMAYTFDIARSQAPDDTVIEQDGVKLLIGREHFAYFIGARLDYVRDGLKEGFKFDNPNEKSACGCGESVGF